MTRTIPTIAALDAILDRYGVVLCDVWGVLHNGETSFRPAAEALRRARDRGLAVILITNAPRPHGPIEQQLAELGVSADAWDRVVTSGDVTRALIAEGPRRIFHIGPERDLSLYDGIDVELCEAREASAIVCTGLFDDETETPQDYSAMLAGLRSRNLPFICANPDIVVERGEQLIWCAGALARDYAELGGRTLIAGKPHAPIYAAALAAAAKVLGRQVARSEALAIGDGVLTDVKGAADNGIDVLYVTGGIHAREYGHHADEPDAERLGAFLLGHGFDPVAVIPRLR